jgi:hypothetical protein
MALPIRGIWAARAVQPGASVAVWGTGINPVHSVYGSPAARLSRLRPMEGMPGDVGDHTPPYEGVPDAGGYAFTQHENTVEGIYYDNRPAWDVPTEDSPVRVSTQGQPSYNASGSVKNTFRAMFEGAGRTFRGKRPRADYQIPTETVSEGWLNKPNFGPVAVAKPSDPVQYERQTSMQQRFAARSNELSQLRGTDALRHMINSRIQPQRSPVYSGEERHYDMFPVQQSPDTRREFYYRTAGTGNQQWLESNQMWDINAVERTPPPDPYIGTPDQQVEQFGYTTEDYFYA